jgi:hypothetical protein
VLLFGGGGLLGQPTGGWPFPGALHCFPARRASAATAAPDRFRLPAGPEFRHVLLNERDRVAALMAASRLPTVYGYREHVDAGGLISYGVDLAWCGRRAATYVQKILNGTPPGSPQVRSSCVRKAGWQAIRFQCKR